MYWKTPQTICTENYKKEEFLMSKTVTFEWKDADIAPDDFELPVVYCTGNNKIASFKNTYGMYNGDESTKHSNWNWLREKYNVKYWVYQKDLL